MPDALKPEPTPQSAASPEDRDTAETERLERERENDRAVKAEMSRRSRRAFTIGGMATLGGLGAFAYIRTRRLDNGIQWPIRRVLEVNEELSRDYFNPDRKTKEFSAATTPKKLRINERIGMEDPLVPAEWSLAIEGADLDSDDPVNLSLADIRKMPRTEQTTLFKCIEGWSQQVTCAGTRFRDFAKVYPPPQGYSYVGMETPGAGYYVGLDLASAMQEQTLLCYELNGEPLSEPHGAPLRLIIPSKYGIKNLKRIGKIFYAQERPKDYWAEQGYDWYAGL